MNAQIQPYQVDLAKPYITVPDGNEVRLILSGGRGKLYAGPNKTDLRYVWRGGEWRKIKAEVQIPKTERKNDQ